MNEPPVEPVAPRPSAGAKKNKDAALKRAAPDDSKKEGATPKKRATRKNKKSAFDSSPIGRDSEDDTSQEEK